MKPWPLKLRVTSQSRLCPDETHFVGAVDNSGLQHSSLVWPLCLGLLPVPARLHCGREQFGFESTYIKTSLSLNDLEDT